MKWWRPWGCDEQKYFPNKRNEKNPWGVELEGHRNGAKNKNKKGRFWNKEESDKISEVCCPVRTKGLRL